MSDIINESENSFDLLFKKFPFNLSLLLCKGNKDTALSIYIPGIDQALDSLLENEKKIILMRFKEMKSLEEISKEFGWISREGSRQMINNAINHLRCYCSYCFAISYETYRSDINSLKSEISTLTMKFKEFTTRLNSLDIEKGLKNYVLDVIDPEDFDCIKNVTIDQLGLSARSFNALKKVGINTLGDLSMISKYKLSRIRNLGVTSVEEILNKLKKYDIELKES